MNSTCPIPLVGFTFPFNMITDTCMDFLLAKLPTLKLPKIEKTYDGSQVAIDNIDLGRCIIKKENVSVQLLQRAPLEDSVEHSQICCSQNRRDSKQRLQQNCYPSGILPT